MNQSSFDPNRRELLKFLGVLGTAALWHGASAGPFGRALAGGAAKGSSRAGSIPDWDGRQISPFQALPGMVDDDLVLAAGSRAEVLLKYGDPINDRGDWFGFANDFIAFLPLSADSGGIRIVTDLRSQAAREANAALLWVNHETPLGILMMHGNPGVIAGGTRKTADQVRHEQLAIGASIVRLIRDDKDSPWRLDPDRSMNRRLNALTPIPFARGVSIRGADHATGTLANCGGGVTPWGTVLTCEENYKEFYGELDGPDGPDWQSRVTFDAGYDNGWRDHVHHHPYHYGWVVEVNPLNGNARKLVAMGRVSREGARVTIARDGRAVVYSGDDCKGGCIFKFVSARSGDLSEGTLYAADVTNGRWVELNWSRQEKLRAEFADQLDVLLHARKAGIAAGATPMDRPEGIDLHPRTGDVFVSLTNNASVGNHHGSLLRIREAGGDPLALEFDSATFLAGGPQNDFTCPDNIAFDAAGNLWFTTDVSKDKINKGPYAGIGNNAFFVVPASGPDAGKPRRFASGPVESELTGPCFSADEDTLFLSVQHPGEATVYGQPYTSTWPAKTPGAKPLPAVVAITGLPWA